MADEQNLELPKLFRRRRKEAPADEAAPEAGSPRDGGAPGSADSSVESAASPDEAATSPVDVAPEPTPRQVSPEPPRSEDASQIPASDEPPVPDETPVHASSTSTEPVTAQEPTRVLAEGPPPPVAVREREAPADAADPEPVERGPRLTLPQVPGVLAAALTGLIVGAVAVGLVLGAGLGCRAAIGTSSCGGGPGTLILLGILALAVVIGTQLMRAWGVTEGLSVSVLAVGLVGVAILLFLLDVVFSAWMIVVIPLLTIAAFALAWWVTVRLAAEAATDLD